MQPAELSLDGQPLSFRWQRADGGHREIARFEDLTRQGFAKQEPLHLIAPQHTQQARLIFRLHTFSHHIQIHRMRQGNDCGDLRQPIRRLRQVSHEGAINLERVQRQLRQTTERGEACAEVIDRDAHSHRTNGPQRGDTVLEVLHDHSFGDLQPRK